MADQGQKPDLLWTSEPSLELLGPLRLGNSAGDDLTPKPRKTRALLALVALSKGSIPRARLTDLLWGDRGEEQAKASLRQALYELRTLASAGYLTADRQAIGTGPKKLPTDLGRIQRLIDGNDADGLASALEAVDCPILADLDDITPELDEWLRDERVRVSGCIVGGALGVGEAALDCGNAAAARRIADQLERLDPLDERAARLGIGSDLTIGDRPAAMRRYARFAARLQDQLAIRPSAETEALLTDTKEAFRPARAAPAEAPVPPATRSRPRIIAAALVVLTLAAAALLFVMMRAAPVDAMPTVAVLPFDDLGQAKEGYFASGVSDEILNLLGRQKRIRILGRFSAAELADRGQSLATARKLGVSYLLDGSVRTSGERVLVIARLTKVADGAQIWSERYERRAGDIFAVQSDIANAVARRVARAVAGGPAQTTRPEAYDRYLAARQLVRERREPTMIEAARLLREAIRLDPNYAPAYAELSQVTMLLADHPTAYGHLPLLEARAEALRLARRALQLDPNLGDGYAALGFVDLSDERSAPYYRKAVELSPQRPEFHRWLAQSLWSLRRYDEAIPEFRRAVDIDPLWELNYEHLVGALHVMGRDAEAQSYSRRFQSLATDRRARLQYQRFLANHDTRMGDSLLVSKAMFAAYPDERQVRFNYGSSLAVLGERRAALRLYGDDPVARAVLSQDWKALGPAARRLGPGYWEYGRNVWNLDRLLLATGQHGVIVDLYDQAQPIVARGKLRADKLYSLSTVIALRRVGRNVEAAKLMAAGRRLDETMPMRGQMKLDREISLALDDIVDGRAQRGLPVLLRWSRAKPLYLTFLPAMSLRYDPLFEGVLRDPRFAEIDENVHQAVNRERARAGLGPISRAAWISDPKSLLTKN
jgi:TolB-like protein/DNA-binding SARP family transcriptional activator